MSRKKGLPRRLGRGKGRRANLAGLQNGESKIFGLRRKTKKISGLKVFPLQIAPDWPEPVDWWQRILVSVGEPVQPVQIVARSVPNNDQTVLRTIYAEGG